MGPRIGGFESAALRCRYCALRAVYSWFFVRGCYDSPEGVTHGRAALGTFQVLELGVPLQLCAHRALERAVWHNHDRKLSEYGVWRPRAC
jgi:hypothetical protein